MSQSPIERFLDAIDRLDVDAAMALMAPNARVLVADGRRAEGTEAVRQLFGDFLAQLRFTTHRITAQWHQEDVWIAEVDASYELRDWLQLNESWYVLNAATSAAGTMLLPAIPAKHGHGSAIGAVRPCAQAAEWR